MERFFSKILDLDNKLANFFLLGRPWNGILIGFLALVGYSFSTIYIEFSVAVSLFIAFIFAYAGGTTLNDIFDFNIDKFNMPYRPLQRKKITIDEAKKFGILMYAFSLLISLQNFYFLISILAFIFFSIIYSTPPFNLVKRHIFAYIVLAIVTIFIPFMAGMFVGINSINFDERITLPILTLTILFFGISILKDLKDIEGDRKGSKNTIAVLIGEKKSRLLSGIITVIFFSLNIYYWLDFIKNKFIFIFLSVIILLSIVFTIFFTNKNQKMDRNLFEEQRFLRVRILFFIFILIIFLFHF